MIGDRRGSEDRYVALLGALAATGRRGRELAVRLDLVRSLGPVEAWRRRGEERRLAGRDAPGIRPGYLRLWSDAADAIGASAVELGDGFLEVRRGERRTRVWHSWVPLDDAVTLRFADDKLLARAALEEAGLPVPSHIEFEIGDIGPALAFLAERGRPCVVKPIDAAGGSGATTGIRTRAQLRRACLRARRIGRRMMIERHVPGDLYRLLFLEGELLDAVRRLPPRVTGDGRATIADLVAAENRRRLAAADGGRAGLLRLDLDAVLTLEHLGLRPSSVLAEGQRIAVKAVVNQNGPDDNESARDAVAEPVVAEARRAASAVGVRLAGVDLIATDPARPLRETGGAILEVNGTPGLHYHYDVADPGRATPVCVPILERLLGSPT